MAWLIWAALVATFNGPVVWLPTLLTMVGQPVDVASRWALLIALAQFPGSLAAVGLIDRLGRKPLIVGALALSMVGMLGLSLGNSHVAIVLGGGLLSAAVLAAWPVILAYAAELYPTRLRSTGAGWATAAGRVGALISPALLGLMLGNWGVGRGPAIAVYVVALVGAVAVILVLGEETAGRTLEELSS